MSKLSNEDKLAIQENIAEFNSHDQFVRTMADKLGATQKDVRGYVDELFMSMMKIESNAQVQEREAIAVAEKQFAEGVVDRTIGKLRTAGLKDEHARRLMDRALAKVDNSKIPDDEADQQNQLFNFCIGQINSADAIIRETEAGRKGIAIMTEGASGRSDDEFKEHKKITHKSRGAVFGIDGNEKTE